MKKNMLLILLVLLLVISLVASGCAKPTKTVEIATAWGPQAGTNTVQGVVLSKLLEDHSTWLKSSPVIVTGYAKGVEVWEKSKEEGIYSLNFNNTMISQYTKGIGQYEPQGPRKDQGLLWPVYVLATYFVTRADSGIKTMEDIKGKTVATGEPGTGAFIMSKDMLGHALGFEADKDYKALYCSISDIPGYFKEGTADVATSGDMSAPGARLAYLEDITNSVDCHFIPAKQEYVDRINQALGLEAYFLYTLPAGIYRGQDEEVLWAAQTCFCTLPLMYDEEIAYELCRVWWDFHDEGVETNLKVALSRPELCQTSLQTSYAFDWHPGALKYYKEKGWIK